jgi:diguanylate cyclase (GGDEF)-like protein/PAS domain S-box-containing protein
MMVHMKPDDPALSPDDAKRLLAALMEACREGVTVTGPDGRIEWVNQAFTTITGYEPGEVLGKNTRALKSDRHDEAFYAALWSELSGTGRWEGEIWNRRKSGEAYPGWLNILAVRDTGGRVARYVAVFRDLSDIKRHTGLLSHLAYNDPLTSLPNRHLFLDRLGMALSQSSIDGNPVGVVCLDLDHFKAVNDSLGHAAGDAVLSQVAARLSLFLRQADTLSRFDGDTFYMLLTGLRDPEDAAHVAGRIFTSLAEPMEVASQKLHISASLGITISPADGSDPAQLMQNAETAMYRAKQAGRNNFLFFTEELGSRVLNSLVMENDLRKALSRQEFVLHYQPRVDIFSGKILGMEALLRWITPEGKLVLPGEFIPLAEETGLILALGDWIVGEACRQTLLWAQEGLGELRVAVNLSPRQLDQPGLAAKILAMLRRIGMPARMLEVEITESVFLKGFEAARDCLEELAAAGISVALDDFGTGYSSLTYLKKLPIGTLKIDKSFVHGLPNDKGDAAIVASVVSIARNLGLNLVAEGVENPEQLKYLRGLGRSGGFQGYLFAGPLPPLEFARLLARGGLVIPEVEK